MYLVDIYIRAEELSTLQTSQELDIATRNYPLDIAIRLVVRVISAPYNEICTMSINNK